MKEIAVEFDPTRVRKRIWQVLPGVLSWSTLIGLVVLAFVKPYWIAVFVIAYDVYILVRIVYMSVHLIYAYRQLKLHNGIDWVERCRAVSEDIGAYITRLQERKQAIEKSDDPADKRTVRQINLHLAELAELQQEKVSVYPWEQVHHVVVLPTYDESLLVLRSSIEALSKAEFPKERMHVVVGFEERAGAVARDKARALQEEFGDSFQTFISTFHPDGLPGEKRVKSANACWAVQEMEKVLQEQGIKSENVIISNFDSDTVIEAGYFGYVTYAFITSPDRYQLSYQPIPVYNNNLWDAPAFSRVIAMGSTFWQMIESTRPERMVTFSSHSMTLKALQEVGYWHRDVVSEDSRIFWQALLHYEGAYRTQPLYITVSMDAALAQNWWQTLKNQYKQKRRWAWGIENFSYMVEGFIKDKAIPLKTKLTYSFRTLEGHYSWATSAIIVAGLGWLPVFFGNPAFHATVLSYSLPFVTRTLMTIAMSGLIISATLTLLLLAPKARKVSGWKYVGMMLQWVLVPIIATLLSAFPALDAETRLLLGRDLHFNVMQKSRRKVTHNAPA